MSWINDDRYLTQAEMENNAQLIYNYLYKRVKITPQAMAGLLGNLQVESTVNPGLWERKTYPPGDWESKYWNGYGLVQWTPALNYIEWAGGVVSRDPLVLSGNTSWIGNGPLELDRLIYESEQGLEWMGNAGAVGVPVNPPFTFYEFWTQTAYTPYTLAEMFLYYYERPANPTPGQRGNLATTWYTWLIAHPPQQAKMPVYMMTRRRLR